jgi:pyruvate kinase
VPPSAAALAGWDEATCRSLIAELAALREALLQREAALAALLADVDPSYRASARNLVHYLELRRVDLRPLQEKLARLGISSLGRSESHVLANVDKALGILHRLAGLPWTGGAEAQEPAGINTGRSLLERHTHALLGAPPPGRRVRIMVTLPSEAAADYGLVKRLVAAGMDVARINCAHDGPEQWRAMSAFVRRAAHAAGRSVRVLMDLGGPKLRTESLPPGPTVLKLRPERDELGRVLAPARLGLRADAAAPPVDGATAQATADAAWLSGLRVRDVVRLVDARGARRELVVERRDAHGALLRCDKTAYLVPKTELQRPRRGHAPRVCRLAGLPRRPSYLRLTRGDVLRLVRSEAVAASGRAGSRRRTHTIGCSLPEVFAQVRKGERVWFDDGRIGGIVRAASAE